MYPGRVLNVYPGRADQGPLRLVVRADRRVLQLRFQYVVGEVNHLLVAGAVHRGPVGQHDQQGPARWGRPVRPAGARGTGCSVMVSARVSPNPAVRALTRGSARNGQGRLAGVSRGR